MMNTDESGVSASPRPAPASCTKDLWIPAPSALGVCVRSVCCAHPQPEKKSAAQTPTVLLHDRLKGLLVFIVSPPPLLRSLKATDRRPFSLAIRGIKENL